MCVYVCVCVVCVCVCYYNIKTITTVTVMFLFVLDQPLINCSLRVVCIKTMSVIKKGLISLSFTQNSNMSSRHKVFAQVYLEFRYILHAVYNHCMAIGTP